MRLRLHRDGRTATGSATVVDEAGVPALVERVLDAVRVAPLDPGWPGLAPMAAPAPTAPLDPADGRGHAGRPGAGRAGLRRRRRRPRGGRVRPHEPLDRRVRQLRRAGRHRRGGRVRDVRPSPATTAPTGSPATRRVRLAELDGAALGAVRGRQGPGLRRPGRAPRRALRGGAGTVRRHGHVAGPRVRGLQRQGVERAALVRAAGRGPARPGHHDRRRPAVGRLRLRPRRHAPPAARPRRRRDERRRDPRSPVRRRGRDRVDRPRQRRRVLVRTDGLAPHPAALGRGPGRGSLRRARARPTSTVRSPTRRWPSWWPAWAGACWSPTSGTPGCSTRAPSPSPA